MRILKIAGVSVLALSLVLGLALPALAAPPEGVPPRASHMPPKLLMGKVVSVNADEQIFVIQSGWWQVTVSVNGDTQYLKAPIPRRVVPLARSLMELRQESQERLGVTKWLRPFIGKAGLFFRALVPWSVPGLVRHQLELREQGQETLGLGRWLRPLAEEATFDDIAVGTHVVVRSEPGEGNPVAKLVIIIKPTTYESILGEITSVSSENKTITIATAEEGDGIGLSYNEETRFILRGITKLEVGQSVRAVYDEDMIAKVVLAPVEVP